MTTDSNGTTDASIAIIGAGVVGASTALRLARRDVDVTLFDAGDVADGASGSAAGICYDAFADPTNAEIAGESLSMLRDRGAIADHPYVWFAREGDERNAEAIRETVPRMQEQDRAVTFVERTELGARWPGLRTDDVEVAAVARNAGLVDTGAFARETAQFAVSSGAEILTNTRARLDEDGRVNGESYDAVVVAAGAHTGRLLDAAGYPLAVESYRVQAYLTEPVALADRTPSMYDATEGYYARPMDGRLLVGDGTIPEPHDPTDWTRAADGWFRHDCAEYLETAVGEPLDERRSWAGLCTATPDGDPLVGERAPGIYVATGFQGHGFMRAPAVAARLADQVLGDEGIAAYDPTRFDGDEEFEIVEGMTFEN
jgi:glycine/D-amino acid oxidase-like deaminating enzyme